MERIKIECSGTDHPEGLEILEEIRRGIPARTIYYDGDYNELPWGEGAAYIAVSPIERTPLEWWDTEYIYNGDEYENANSIYEDTDYCGGCALRNGDGMCHLKGKYTGRFHRCGSHVRAHRCDRVDLHEYKTPGELFAYTEEHGLEEAVLGAIEKNISYDYITVNGQITEKRGKTYFRNEEVTLPTKGEDAWAVCRRDLICILVMRRGLSYVIVRPKSSPHAEEVLRAVFEDYIEFRGIHTIDELLEEIAGGNKWAES